MNIVSIATRLFTSAVLRFSLEQLHASCTLASTLPSLYDTCMHSLPIIEYASTVSISFRSTS